MAIDSTSTLTDVLAQYNDNLDYDGNATKAALALAAVRWLLINRAQTTADGGTSLNYASLEKEKERLEDYVNQIGAGASRRSLFTRGRALL